MIERDPRQSKPDPDRLEGDERLEDAVERMLEDEERHHEGKE